MDEIKAIEEKIKTDINSVDPSLIYKVANYYFTNHNLDEALKYYNLLLKVDPNHKMGLFELGSIYSNIGNLNEAINLWQKVISLDPHFTRAHFNLALAYSKLKRYSDALSEFHITLSLVRQSGDPVGLEKRILQEIKRIQELQANIGTSDSVQDIETQRQYALILMKKGDLDGAIQAFKEIIKIDSDDVVSLLNLGIIYYKKKQYEEALDYLSRVIEIKPDDSDAYFHIASIYEEMGDLKIAIDYYKKAISYNPNNYFWYYRIGRILYTLGAYDEAIKYYKKAVELNPLDNYSHNNLGMAYLEAGNVTEAIKHFLKAIYLDPNDSYSYYNLAKAYVKLGQLNKAYKSIQKAIELEQKPVYYLEAARILYKLRNYRESLVFAVKATEMDPNLYDAYILISKLYAVAKKYDEGIAILEKFANFQRINLVLELAQMYYIKGEVDKAIATLKSILSNANEKDEDIVWEATRRLIRIYLSTGSYNEAYDFCKNLLSRKFLDKEDYFLLISVFLKIKKYPELYNILSHIDLDSEDGDIIFYYAYCAIKIGLFDVAKKYLEKLYSSYSTKLHIAYYYFYSLLKNGDYTLAREIFSKIEQQVFSDPLSFDNLFENYIELLFVFNEYDLLFEKSLYFLNSQNVEFSQKQRILFYLFKSLYNQKKIEKIIEFENFVDYFDEKVKYIFLLSLLIKKDYSRLNQFISNFLHDFEKEEVDENYLFIFIISLLKLGFFEKAKKLAKKIEGKNKIIDLKLKMFIDVYENNLNSAVSLIKENLDVLYNFYVMLGIIFDFVNREDINKIWNNLPDFLKDIWEVYSFNYLKINDENLNKFWKLVEKIEKYVSQFEFVEDLYLLPDNIVVYYLYNPALLFLYKLTSFVDNYMLFEEWNRINVFREVSLKERKKIYEKLSFIFERVIGIHGNYYITYLYAKYALITGDLDKAISFLFESLNYDKYFYSARFLLSSIYYLREMYDLAIEQLIDIYHNDNEILRFLLGKNYIATKSFKLAEEEFNYLYKRYPNNYMYLYYKVLANVYMMNLKAVEELENLFKEVSKVKSSKEFLEIALYLAYIYILTKKYKEAEQILLDLLNTFNNNELIYKYLAIIYISTNQIPKVLNVYNMGIKNIPDSSDLYSQRGVLYYKANKLDLAEKDFLKAYELNRIDFVAVSHLGLICLKKDDYVSALNYFKEAISIKPLAYDVYTNIGNVYEKMGKIIEAKEYFEMAYEHNPSNIQNIKKLIEILKKLSDTLKLQMIKEEIEKNPSFDPQIKSELISLIGG